MKTHPHLRSHPEHASVLIVAMILCAVIGLSIASYIQLSKTSLTISNRAFYNNTSMNLAENGLEEAMYSINKMVEDDTYSWTTDGWSVVDTNNARRQWTGYTFDQNATGKVRVYVYNYLGTVAPKLVARSTITLGGATAAPIEKWIEVQLAKTSKFANGLVARQQVRFSGNNATVDSWNSDPDNNPATAAIPYSAATKNDEGSVGSIAVTVDAVLVQNADIFGYVATGGVAATVGSQGLIGPFGTTSGTIAAGHSSTDFSASFDAVTAPTATYAHLGAITNTTTLPGATDTPAADGKYYYSATQVNFNNKSLNITAGKDVVLRLTDAITAISIGGGSGAINLNTGSKLAIYADGDISVAGNGIMNGGTTSATANQPINFQIWGTKTTGTQNIAISGNGVLSAIVYAPQGSVRINGNGDVSGSVVANDITCVGNALFHYDESLGNFGGGNPYRVTLWRELTTATDRNTYSSVLGF